MKDTVCIVGSHPRTRTEFDFTRTDCDIWVFNEALSNPEEKWCPRADAVFQMHAKTIWMNPENRNDKNHAHWLTTQTETPVYMQEQYAEVPMCVKYPLEEVCQGLHFNKRYFTSSVAYALALASYLEYKKIEMYGVEMETDTEYRYQRDGVTFWIGIALGREIEVVTHCAIFDLPLYGYEGDVKLDYGLFKERAEELQKELPALQTEYNKNRLFVADLIRKFTETGKDEGIVEAVQEQLKYGIQYGQRDGARQENERYLAKADKMIEASGEFLFSRQEFEAAKQAMQKKQAELMTKSTVLAGQTEIMFKQCENANRGKRKKRIDEFVAVLDTYIKTTITTAMIVGGLNENQRFLMILDEKIRAAGGAKSEAVMLEAYANRQQPQ